MARTLNGNRTGRAAHGVDELEVRDLVRTDQDKRIGKKKALLKDLMGDDFVGFYIKTPISSDALEKALDEKLAEYEIKSLNDMTDAEQKEWFEGVPMIDPRSPEERALDEFSAEVKETEMNLRKELP